MREERRDFLKLTAAGATGLALARSNRAYAAWPSSGTLELNPAIPNMRVVACVDTAMVKSVPANMTFETQNAAIDYARVQANMDAMAMTLAQKSTAEEAWKTIFRSSRDWASTVVAIKANAGEPKNAARLAVLQKLSNLFTGWGVKPENFIVYDGHTAKPDLPSFMGASFSTTDKSKVLGVVGGPTGSSLDLLGGWKDAKLVDGTTRRCAAKLVDGTVDILIDIANNKGHSMFGKVTLCMKNHYGTWEPDTSHTDLNNLIFKMNKSDPIIGGTPPRQQLCIVDSLFCNKVNITGTPELMPCYLVMGTFAPAVDYLTVRKIREGVSNLNHDSAVIDSYVTSFGYKTSDPQWIVVPPGGATADAGTSGSGGTSGAGGSGGKGSGGANAGGRDGSASAGGGTKGSGGVGSGGNGGERAPGGAGGTTGSAGGTSGLGSGGSSGGPSTGGSSGSGGSAGASSSSTRVSSVGGSDGRGSGGASVGDSNGSGGSAGHASGGATSAAGGLAAAGGGNGATTSPENAGCDCRVGVAGGRPRGLELMLALGAVAAGQLRRLLVRRDALAKVDPAEGRSSQAAGETDPTRSK
jgi:hypothetical protein